MAPGKPASKGGRLYKPITNRSFLSIERNWKAIMRKWSIRQPGLWKGFCQGDADPKNGGQTLVSTAKYLNILKKQGDGTWKTTHDVWNGNEE
jgi:hypothetical protein